MLHTNAHFVGIHIRRNGDGSFSITYFDPVLSKVNNSQLHPIPSAVLTALNNHFRNVPIVATTSSIQTYTQLRLDHPLEIDNNHCGPFVVHFMTEIACGRMRLNPNGNGKIQSRSSEDALEEWKDIDSLSKEKSDELGKAIRASQAEALLAKDNKNDSSFIRNAFQLVDHYRGHLRYWNDRSVDSKESENLGLATSSFDASANIINEIDLLATVMDVTSVLLKLDKAINLKSPEKGLLAVTTLKKKLTDQYGLAYDFYRESGIAYSQGKEEEGSRLYNVGRYYNASATFLTRSIVALKNQMEAENPEKKKYWSELAAQYQIAANYSLKVALAYKKGTIEDAKKFSEKLNQKREKIVILQENLEDLEVHIEDIFYDSIPYI